MRYRAMDDSGDYKLGGNSAFFVNSPEAVTQAIQTRLRLWRGEWFINTKDGTPWATNVLGKRKLGRIPDTAIKQRILGTQGVTDIVSFVSTFNGETRSLTVNATVNTKYGQATVTEAL